jgi:hypothetical protein
VVAAQGRGRPTTKKASAAHQIASHGAPRAKLHLARGPGVAPRNLRLARGLDAPRVNLRLAQGPDASSGEFPPRSRDPDPERVSASLEATLDPRHCTGSPDRSIKCSSTLRAPRSKENPRHASPLKPPGNHIPALFDQPALCGHPRRCAGRPVSFHDTVLPTPVPPTRCPPRKRTVASSKGLQPPTPPRFG